MLNNSSCQTDQCQTVDSHSAYAYKTTLIEQIFCTIRSFIGAVMWIVIAYIGFGAFKSIAFHSAGQIGALAKLTDSLKLHYVVPWLCVVFTGTAWKYERTGKKRAIREKSKYQKIVEADDPQRTSSGLTDTGDTPGE